MYPPALRIASFAFERTQLGVVWGYVMTTDFCGTLTALVKPARREIKTVNKKRGDFIVAVFAGYLGIKM